MESLSLTHPSCIISLFDDENTRWKALESRNANADGFFVYAVRTTGIYCRPTCKARLARRANVSFFDEGAQAQAAGFRACKRCKPDVAGFMPEEVATRKIRAFVMGPGHTEADASGRGPGSLSQMARQTGLSKWHFHRVFKKTVGMTPVEYLRTQRQPRQWSSCEPVGSPDTASPDTASPDEGDGVSTQIALSERGPMFRVTSQGSLPDELDFDWGMYLQWPDE